MIDSLGRIHWKNPDAMEYNRKKNPSGDLGNPRSEVEGLRPSGRSGEGLAHSHKTY